MIKMLVLKSVLTIFFESEVGKIKNRKYENEIVRTSECGSGSPFQGSVKLSDDIFRIRFLGRAKRKVILQEMWDLRLAFE